MSYEYERVVAPADAAKWIETLSAPPVRSLAIADYAQAAASWAPDLAVKLITRLAPELAGTAPATACVQQ